MINVAALLGVLVVPCTGKPVFGRVLPFFVALSIGSLLSNALFQLIPEVRSTARPRHPPPPTAPAQAAPGLRRLFPPLRAPGNPRDPGMFVLGSGAALGLPLSPAPSRAPAQSCSSVSPGAAAPGLEQDPSWGCGEEPFAPGLGSVLSTAGLSCAEASMRGPREAAASSSRSPVPEGTHCPPLPLSGLRGRRSRTGFLVLGRTHAD